MLIRFTVGNFRSFDKNQTLSLIAGSVQNKKERLYSAKDFKILKFASIFGANAAGKSNFIQAMSFANNAILFGLDIPVFENKREFYFKLNPLNKDKPSYFEFEIILNDNVYSYGFEMLINQKKITEEWFIKLNKNKDEQIYTRNAVTGHFYFNEDYLSEDTSSRMNIYLEDFKNVTNKLFLSELVSNKEELYKNNDNLSILKDLFNWVLNLNITYPETTISGYDCFSKKNFDKLLKAIQSFNTGISSIKPREITKESALEKLSPHSIKDIEEAIQRSCPPECNKSEKECENCGFRFNSNGRLIFVNFKNRAPVFTEITFEHFGVKDIDFSLKDESDGTQRLLDLLSVLFTQKDNSVFVIDEIDRSLHPQLTIHFIQTFLQIAEKKNIQLIITTHESHLLNLEMLRQDEIFFVDVSHSGESILYPFDRFKERFDKKIEKAYLDGRYGAVPLFDTFYSPFVSNNED